MTDIDTATDFELTAAQKKKEEELLDRIGRARTKLMARLPFFGHLSLKLRPRLCRPDDQIQTAGVGPDGTLVFNEAFVAGLSDPELCFVLAHEVMHPALLYWDRMQGRQHDLWNIAHDYAINLIIQQMVDPSLKLLDDIRLDQKYKDLSAEEIYDDLLKDTVLVNIVQGGKPQGGKGGGKGGQKQPGGGRPGDSHKPGDKHDIFNDPLFGDAKEGLNDTEQGKRAQRGDKGAKTTQDNDWKISIVSAAQKHEADKGRGSMPLGLTRLIDELVNPKISWLERLSRWVGEHGKRCDYTYQRPSRRSESVGQYMPSMKKYGFTDVTVLMDTSGSISMDMLKQGVSEVQGVCEDLGISVRCMVVDAAVHHDVKVEDAWELLANLSGGGGSDFNPAFDLLVEEGYEGVVLAFTDGDIAVPADKPEQIKAVMWCIYEGCRNPAKWGELIEIPRDDKDSERN